MRSKKKEKYHYIFKKRHTLYILLAIICLVGMYNQLKPLPQGVAFESKLYNISDEYIQFLADFTYSKNNETIREQAIFDALFTLIESANKSVLIDAFLFNNDFSHEPQYRELTNELTNLLITKRDLEITLITDRINTFYGSYTPEHIQKLEDANISIVYTDMNTMRDSNPLYTTLWRVFIRWIPLPIKMSHPLKNIEHTVRMDSILEILTSRANHRKIAIIDGTHAWISSANPHTASSGHSNVGAIFSGNIVNDILQSEKEIAAFSGHTIKAITQSAPTDGPMQIQALSEKKIRDAILQDIDDTTEGDTITVMIFYISDRKIVNSLKKAAKRGVQIDMVLDANKDAFAREKNGIPNRQVAYELSRYANIKWYHTTGEQYHTKMIVIEKKGKRIIHLGSANFTRRNLGNYNLELNIRIITPEETQFNADIVQYIDRIFSNKDGLFTVNITEFYDNSWSKYLLYRFQEWSGLSTF